MEFKIDQPAERFTNHLNVAFNERIIFSGPFGTGKTYFLRKYFENNQNYNTIHLFPVNYSVASNEDIFELVKYDVLFELLTKDLEFSKIEIPHIQFIKQFAAKNSHHILAPFLHLIPELGKSLYSIYEKLQLLGEKYFEEYDGANTDDKKAVIDYLGEFTREKGSIYEEDFFTQLICQLTEQLKIEISDKKKCETVLIIDDLDRIDPEHIFRILNVLSAHMDKYGELDNKFNFDKIILVFDQENVHRIFQNRYGSNVDYSGYIDKFYSYRIFDFENTLSVTSSIINCLQTIERPDENDYLNFHSSETIFTQNIVYVLSALVVSKKLTIRRLKKVMQKPFYRLKYRIPLEEINKSIDNSNYEILFLTDFLLSIYGSWEELIHAISECNEFAHPDMTRSMRYRFISFCLVLLDSVTHNFNSQLTDVIYNHEPSNQAINYNTQDWHKFEQSFLCNVRRISYLSDPMKEIESPKYFPILKETLIYLKNHQLVKLT